MVGKHNLHKHLDNIPPFKRNPLVRRPHIVVVKEEKERSIDVSMKKILRDKAIHEVDEAYHNLVAMNIPKLQLDCAFNRKEIYMIYAKFKALSKISKVSFPHIVKDDIGVEKSVYINCM
jgi:Ca2+-binding EF-hand superfamily protein